jgi:hypothetical protein
MAFSIEKQRTAYRSIAPSISGATALFFVATKITPTSGNPYELASPNVLNWAQSTIRSGVEVFNLRQASNESRGRDAIARKEYGTEDCPKWRLTIPNTSENRALQEYSKELYCTIPAWGNLPTVTGRVESIQIKKTQIIRITIKQEAIPV